MQNLDLLLYLLNASDSYVEITVTLINLHTLEITIAHTESSQFVMPSLVIAR